MDAVAILGPDVSPESLALFSAPDWNLSGHTRGRSLDRADAALVLGGDGTVHHYLSDLSRLKVPLLMVPLGSGNDFAGALGLRTRQQALAAWKRFRAGAGNVRPIDLGMITPLGVSSALPRLFCNVAGVGLDSEANRRANALPRWLRGRGGYLLSALGALRTFKPMRFVIEAPLHRRIDEPGLFVAFANGPTYGGGFRIAPKADFSDGQLDICYVRRMPRIQLLRLLPTVFSGRHVQHGEVEYFKTSCLRIETAVPLDVYADGEFACRTPVEVSVMPNALQVIVP